jgi:hypothetical protein
VEELRGLLAQYEALVGLNWCLEDWRRLKKPDVIDIDAQAEVIDVDAPAEVIDVDAIDEAQAGSPSSGSDSDSDSDRCDHLGCDIRFHRAEWVSDDEDATEDTTHSDIEEGSTAGDGGGASMPQAFHRTAADDWIF